MRHIFLRGVAISIAMCGVGLARASHASAQEDVVACPAVQRQNEATARTVFEEILSRGQIAENEHIYHPNFAVRGLTRDAGRAEDRAAAEGWRAMAPDLRMTVLHVVSDCNFVSVHWQAEGTNTGSGNGFPATGKSLRVRGMTLFRFSEGRIIEEWGAFDMMALMNQLGIASAHGQ